MTRRARGAAAGVAVALVVAGAVAGAAGATTAAQSSGAAARAAQADELRFFSNPGRTVVCRYSSFSGYQQLKCIDRRVRGEDGGALVVRLGKTGMAEELLFDSGPMEKIGLPVARFSRPGIVSCTLTKAAVRCANAAKHGMVLQVPKLTRF